jgi:hypothetical protein
VGPRAGLDTGEKRKIFGSYHESNPGIAARSLSLYQLETEIIHYDSLFALNMLYSVEEETECDRRREKMLKEVAVACTKTVSQYLSGATEHSHGKSESGYIT